MAPNPYIDEQYINFLMDQRMGNAPAALGAPGSDLLSDQGGFLTQVSKLGSQNTDLGTLIALGALPSSAFQDQMGAVDAPGYRMTQQWADPNQGSPLQNYIAGRLQSGKSTNTIYGEIQQMIANGPQDEIQQSIVADLPLQMVETPGGGYEIGEGADLFMVRDTIEQLEDARNADPEYDVVDGRAMSREESPAAIAAREAGYVSTPGEAYDSYDLAPQGTYERDLGYAASEDEAMQKYLLAKAEYDPIQQEYQQNRRDQRVFSAGGTADLQADLDDMRERPWRPAPSEAFEDAGGSTSGLSVASTDYEALPPQAPPPPNLAGGSGFGLSLEDKKANLNLNDEAESRAKTGRYEDRAPTNARRNAWNSSIKSKEYQRARRDSNKAASMSANALYEDQMRQAMARELLNYGMSPFDDERNQRNRLVLGG